MLHFQTFSVRFHSQQKRRQTLFERRGSKKRARRLLRFELILSRFDPQSAALSQTRKWSRQPERLSLVLAVAANCETCRNSAAPPLFIHPPTNPLFTPPSIQIAFVDRRDVTRSIVLRYSRAGSHWSVSPEAPGQCSQSLCGGVNN